MAYSTRRTFIEGAGVWLGTLTLGCQNDPQSASGDGGSESHGDGSESQTSTESTLGGDGSESTGSADGHADASAEDSTGGSTGDTPEQCVPTSPNIEGPFYVEGVPVRTDLDLYGDEGTKLALSGVVRGTDCAPLAGAVVEIWQCDPAGDYDNTSPEMRYRGQMVVGADGRYGFTTLVPGRYPNAGTYRPAHIHVKVWIERVERLTTQIYFEGDPFNETDPWVEDDLIMPTQDDGDGGLVGEIDLVIE
jgi:protocatechuate 3,4-dioxygenase beta subunit